MLRRCKLHLLQTSILRFYKSAGLCLDFVASSKWRLLSTFRNVALKLPSCPPNKLMELILMKLRKSFIDIVDEGVIDFAF